MSKKIQTDHGSATVLGRDSLGYGYIMNVVVHEHQRGKGYGVELMREVVRREGYRTLKLECRTELIPFYEKAGFRQCDPIGGLFGFEPGYCMMMRPATITQEQPVAAASVRG